MTPSLKQNGSQTFVRFLKGSSRGAIQQNPTLLVIYWRALRFFGGEGALVLVLG
jgi:hypothetical protein